MRMPLRSLFAIVLWSAAHYASAAEPALPEWAAYLRRPDADFDLARAALLISREEYPKTNLEAATAKLEAWGERLRKDLTQAGTVQGKLDTLRTFLFEADSFQLPERDDAAAFLLGEILERKRGNCLGLSVLCLALAERADLPLHGVPVPNRLSGPGHLLVRFDDGTVRMNFDPTERGAAHADAHYVELFKLRDEDLKRGYILNNATPKQVANLLLVNLAAARIENSRAAQALPLLEQSLLLQPDYAPAHQNLGMARLKLGDTLGALEAFERALKLQPGLTGARLGLAEVALNAKDSTRALDLIQAVLDEEPEHPQALALLANLHLVTADYRQAVSILKRLVEAAPKDVHARTNLGAAYRHAGDYPEAEAAYRAAIELDPKLADAHFGLAETLRAVGQLDAAARAYARALELDPDHAPTRLSQAQHALNAGNWPEAEIAFRAALKGKPNDPETLRGLVEVLLRQGKLKDADIAVTEALKAQPKHIALGLLAGEVKLKANQPAEALRIYETLRPHAPAEWEIPILQRIAIAQGKLGRHAEALKLARKLLEADGDDLVALRIAASACEGLRNGPQAIAIYRKLLELNPEDTAAKQALARLGAK